MQILSTIAAEDVPYTVALTQISAYIPHKNLAVRKIKEAMPVRKKKRDSVSTRLKQNMKQTITEQYASM